MIALSFLGTGNYSETIYQDSTINKSYKTKYFTEALINIYNPSTVFLVMTKESKLKNGNELAELCNFITIDIPSGESNDEIWQIFDKITQKLPSHEELLIDITHGYRSQPMLALSIAIFLKSVKKIKVNQIIYGAFEARDINSNISPIFDLSPFIHIIDWTFAVENFVRYGQALQLKILLSDLQKKLKLKHDISSSAKSFGNLINDISQSLSFIRPSEVSKLSKELPIKLSSVKKEIEVIAELKPLEYLLNIIPESFSNLAVNDSNIFSNAGFIMQANMLKYYLDTQQFVQAISLAREIIVSVICSEKGFKFLERSGRESAENILNELSTKLIQRTKLEGFQFTIGQLWQKITTARNDIDHAGMRKSYSSASQLYNEVINICEQVILIINKKFN